MTLRLEGAAVLLGSEAIPEGLLDMLLHADLVREVRGSRLAGQRELAFRHIVLRDAAYALLTDEDRRNGHRLAAGWLERAGEVDAETLAAHHERAGDLAVAGAAYELAAARALRAADFEAASRLTDAGLRCATDGEPRLRLLQIAMEARNWLGQSTSVLALGKEADALAAPAGTGSARVLGELAVACGILGDRDLLLALQDRVVACLARSADLADPAACAHTRAGATVMFQLSCLGLRRLLDPWLFDHLERIRPGPVAADERVWGDVYMARGALAMYEGSHEQAALLTRQAGEAYRSIGLVALARTQWANVGHVLMEMGALDEAIVFLRRSLYEGDGRTLWPHHSAVSASNLGHALTCTGRIDEGMALLEQARARLARHEVARYRATAEMYLAEAHYRRGDLARARTLAAAAVAGLRDFPALRAPAEAVHASILLAVGKPAEALEQTSAAVAILEELGWVEERESLVRLVHARALAATGRSGEAHAAAGVALDRLLARAVDLSPRRRRDFLERIEENRATLELARSWGMISGPKP